MELSIYQRENYYEDSVFQMVDGARRFNHVIWQYSAVGNRWLFLLPKTMSSALPTQAVL